MTTSSSNYTLTFSLKVVNIYLIVDRGTPNFYDTGLTCLTQGIYTTSFESISGFTTGAFLSAVGIREILETAFAYLYGYNCSTNS